MIIDYLWFLLIYLFGFISGIGIMLLLAFWPDITKWFSDLRWKIKMRKYR